MNFDFSCDKGPSVETVRNGGEQWGSLFCRQNSSGLLHLGEDSWNWERRAEANNPGGIYLSMYPVEA